MGRVARIMGVKAVAGRREEAGRKEAETKAEEVPGLKDMNKVEIHIIDDINYPASRENIIKAFEGFKDVDPSDKEWVSKHLPEGS